MPKRHMCTHAMRRLQLLLPTDLQSENSLHAGLKLTLEPFKQPGHAGSQLLARSLWPDIASGKLEEPTLQNFLNPESPLQV